MSTSPRLLGATRVPGDKSVAHRALILAAMARSESAIASVPDGRDVASTRRCLQQLGVAFEGGARVVRVRPPDEWRPGHVLDAGNSGTTARLLAGALAARRCAATLTGDASLSARPMERVALPLRRLGASVETTGGRLPMHVRGAALQAGSWEASMPSAQVKSAFLLAATGAAGESSYREAWPTRDHLERMLPWFGIPVTTDADGWIRLHGGRPTGARMTVPGDASSAATLLALAAMLPGSDLAVEGVLLNPRRLGFVDVLRRMGAEIDLAEERAGGGPEPVGVLRLRAPDPLRPVIVQRDETPGLIDELPMLLLASARADGESRFEGLSELRVKESDRLRATCELFEGLGVPHRLDGDDLSVTGGEPLRPCPVDARGDHRIAMLHEAAALFVPGQPSPSDPCVDVSWPGFHEKLAILAR